MERGGHRLLSIAALLLCSGCFSLRGPEDLRRDLSRTAGVELERETGFKLKRSAMWIARLGAHAASDGELSLRGVHRIEIGIYNVTSPADRPRGTITPRQFPDWEPIVTMHDEGEDTLVLLRHEGEEVRGLLVVVADDDEWVLVRLKGHLDRVVEEAVAMAFRQADRPDLYERSREERGLDPLPAAQEAKVESVPAST